MDWWPEWRKLVLLVLPVAALIGFVSAGPAAAHTRLIDTAPGDGKRLTAVPGQVGLTFNQGVLKNGAAVKVTGPDGDVPTGKPEVAGKKVSWPITGGLANGRYAVAWRVTSADGHPISGRFAFALAVPVEPTATPAADPTATPAADPTGSTAAAVATPHTPDPEMTGAMEGMEGMAGRPAEKRSSLSTGVALGGLVLLVLIVAGAIVIERRRRPSPPAAGPSEPPTG